jgi:hypothetical protein
VELHGTDLPHMHQALDLITSTENKFNFGIIVDSHVAVRNNTERSYLNFTQFPPWYCLTVEYNSQDADNTTAKM